MKKINDGNYTYNPNDKEIELMYIEFLYFLKHDLKIDNIDESLIKVVGKNKHTTFETPTRFLYYDIGKKVHSSNPHMKHYKNNECNIFEYYSTIEILYKIKNAIDLL